MTAKQQSFGSTLVPFREKIVYSSIFCFLLILICMSNISYADGSEVNVTLLAIGIHYSGQSDATWVVKEVTNGTTYSFRDGQIQSALEMGVASDLSAGLVDKIAFKFIFTEVGVSTQTGWDVDGDDLINEPTPPTNAKNFLALPGGSSITLEDNSNKKFLFKSANGVSDSVVISDM
jgi:hypothetical protein